MNSMTNDPLNVIITGVGGQGNVLISQVLGRALLAAGKQVTVGETFGLSQRGGSVQSHIRISERETYGPLIPRGRAHVILGLEPLETLRVLPEYGHPELLVLVNSRPAPPLNVSAGEAGYPTEKEIREVFEKSAGRFWFLKATDAASRLGNAVMANMVMLGALFGAGVLPVGKDKLEAAMGEILPANRVESNLAAFGRGRKMLHRLAGKKGK